MEDHSQADQLVAIQQSLDQFLSRPRSRTTSTSFIMKRRRTRSIEDENARLKEMLQQSLKRELDGLSKIKHLQEMYQDLLYRTHSNGEDSKQCKPTLYIIKSTFLSPPLSLYHRSTELPGKPYLGQFCFGC